jgi:hypothetical protein
MSRCTVKVETVDGSMESALLVMDCCLAAGYTGRDQASVLEHINELKKLGVSPPYAIPACYWISPSRLTQDAVVYVVGQGTSPEVEFFLAPDEEGNLYCTVASDHTDRELEAVSVSKSKQVCDKVLGDHFWRVADVAAHWDQIQLRSRVFLSERWIDYQAGTLGDLLPYQDLISLAKTDSNGANACGILSGTLPIVGGDTRYPEACEIAMTDPVHGRSITKKYAIESLPDRS